MSSSPVTASSSSAVSTTGTVVTGLSPVSVDSSSLEYIDLEAYTGDNGVIHIPVELAGNMSPIFPRPKPPVNFAGLPNPTVAPTIAKSTTADGSLLPGTYRYSYAAWKGNPMQATAPSPFVEVTLTIENTVSVTPEPVPGADGYLVYREDL